MFVAGMSAQACTMQNVRLLLGRRSSVGLSYILTTVVDRRAPLFANDAAAALAIQEFQRLDQEGFTRSIAYVVMPDHIHWLVELRAGTLETVMKRFKSRTAQQQTGYWEESGVSGRPATTIMRSARTNRCTGMRCT